ncbi:glycosyltransferase family 4 protein [uncultured Algibacter sp.]|uniref:glycosyltransferase family 4 protein n=1 Tax=uncultured Algibacter sp. TaxID=298659 RepID=UPI0026305079|nr:glycosyltransferase family 4 protein [uncultured Algibacter sp.]
MKDILIITNYFPPETGAASNRILHLAEGLQQHEFKVSVVTPLPNYPTGRIFENYKGYFKIDSIENGIKIHRLWIYASNSKNKFLRLFAMLSYSFSLLWFFVTNKIPKTVIVQSPPLLVAFTAMIFLRSKKRKLILNVSDLWPLAGLELGALKKDGSYKLLERIESFNYKNANLILGQSEEILAHVKSKFPDKETFLYRNYPSFNPPTLLKKDVSHGEHGKLQIVYAGLLGVAQGVYKLCQELDYSNVQLHIYGAGAEQKKIENLIESNAALDVVYHGEVSRKEIHRELTKYDITIIPLLNRIYGSVPSKIFEYAYLGIHMLYFGGGEGEKIIKNHHLGWVAKAGSYNDLNKVISEIKKVEIGYKSKLKIQSKAIENFNFINQLEEFVIKL